MGAESAMKAAPNDRTPIFERHSMDPGSIHKVRHHFKHATGLVGGCEERVYLEWRGKVNAASGLVCGKHNEVQGLPNADPSCISAEQTVLLELLNPRQWKPPEDRSFILDGDQINTLCDQAERVFQREASVLRLRGAAFSLFPGYFSVYIEQGGPSELRV